MDAEGRADNALEQILWAYMIGKRSGQLGEPLGDRPSDSSGSEGRYPVVVSITVQELSTVYRKISGVQPRKTQLQKWIAQAPAILKALEAR